MAENLVTQFVLISFMRNLYQAIPSLKVHILKAFDDAANKH
jgi:hypothetical protein